MSDEDYRRPDYDTLLTARNWDKKKGVFAKMVGRTGIGSALQKLEKTYNQVNWDALEMTKKKPRPFNLRTWDRMRDDAIKEMNGGLAKLRKECYTVRDLAKATEAKFKKKKTVPKSATQLCADIAKQADFMGVGANANSMGTRIEKMYAFGRRATDFTAEGIAKKAPAKVAAALKSLATVTRSPTYETWKRLQMMTRARDVNQYIGNVSKLINMGYRLPLNAGQCDKLFKVMQPYASVDVPFDTDADAEEVKAHVSTLTKAMKAAERVLSSSALNT